jgi:hypothetical protein
VRRNNVFVQLNAVWYTNDYPMRCSVDFEMTILSAVQWISKWLSYPLFLAFPNDSPIRSSVDFPMTILSAVPCISQWLSYPLFRGFPNDYPIRCSLHFPMTILSAVPWISLSSRFIRCSCHLRNCQPRKWSHQFSCLGLCNRLIHSRGLAL